MKPEDKLHVLTTMAQYPAAYAAELSGLSQAVLTWKPSSSEWSLSEVMSHLADAEEIYLNERLRRIVAEDHPAIADFDWEAAPLQRKYNEQDPFANLARFARSNAEIVALA
jgi:hypothetical protein